MLRTGSCGVSRFRPATTCGTPNRPPAGRVATATWVLGNPPVGIRGVCRHVATAAPDDASASCGRNALGARISSRDDQDPSGARWRMTTDLPVVLAHSTVAVPEASKAVVGPSSPNAASTAICSAGPNAPPGGRNAASAMSFGPPSVQTASASPLGPSATTGAYPPFPGSGTGGPNAPPGSANLITSRKIRGLRRHREMPSGRRSHLAVPDPRPDIGQLGSGVTRRHTHADTQQKDDGASHDAPRAPTQRLSIIQLAVIVGRSISCCRPRRLAALHDRNGSAHA